MVAAAGYLTEDRIAEIFDQAAEKVAREVQQWQRWEGGHAGKGTRDAQHGQGSARAHSKGRGKAGKTWVTSTDQWWQAG